MRVKTNFILLFIFIIQLALGTIIPYINGNNVSDYYMIFITQLIPVFVPSIIYLIIKKDGLSSIKRKSGINIVNCILIIITAFAVNVIVNQFISAPIYNLTYKDTEVSSYIYVHNGFGYLIDVFILCVIPALFEEILFRGIALTEYERIYGSKKGIFMCALVFALMHGAPVAFIPQFLIGLFLSFVVFKTQSLYSGILAHFTINFTTLAMQRASVDATSFLRIMLMGNQLIVFLVFLILVLISIWGINKINSDTKYVSVSLDEKELVVEKNFFVLIVIMYVCVQILRLL